MNPKKKTDEKKTKAQKQKSPRKRTIKTPKKRGKVSKAKIKKAIKKVRKQQKKTETKAIKKKQITDEDGLIDPEKIKFKATNVLNVKQYIRKQTKLDVSPTYVHEQISRIKLVIEEDVAEAEAIAKAKGRKTLKEHHLVRAYDFRRPTDHRVVSCTSCGGNFSISKDDIDRRRKLICPFCGRKKVEAM